MFERREAGLLERIQTHGGPCQLGAAAPEKVSGTRQPAGGRTGTPDPVLLHNVERQWDGKRNSSRDACRTNTSVIVNFNTVNK